MLMTCVMWAAHSHGYPAVMLMRYPGRWSVDEPEPTSTGLGPRTRSLGSGSSSRMVMCAGTCATCAQASLMTLGRRPGEPKSARRTGTRTCSTIPLRIGAEHRRPDEGALPSTVSARQGRIQVGVFVGARDQINATRSVRPSQFAGPLVGLA